MVFQAEGPTSKRMVALKVCAPPWPDDAGPVKRFLREAKATAAIGTIT